MQSHESNGTRRKRCRAEAWLDCAEYVLFPDSSVSFEGRFRVFCDRKASRGIEPQMSTDTASPSWIYTDENGLMGGGNMIRVHLCPPEAVRLSLRPVNTEHAEARRHGGVLELACAYLNHFTSDLVAKEAESCEAHSFPGLFRGARRAFLCVLW